jgi:formate C-acetyltransferase
MKAWQGFKSGDWQKTINVREFIQLNYTPYYGDENFLAPATERTLKLLAKFEKLRTLELELDGVLDVDISAVSSLLNYRPGYLDRENELIVGLQTSRPLRRGVNPFGGIRMAEKACQDYGYELSDQIREHFKYRTTHNDGVFRAYTAEMKAARRSGIITGLPDSYGRGRLIGDYRRVALYGVDRLIEFKKQDQAELGSQDMSEDNIKLLEEIWRQIDFLNKLKEMAALYGYDISRPAHTSREAVQWLYFAYLAAIKEQNGAAMSLGRVSTFLDIYFERDLQRKELEERDVQELVDDFVIKLRMARQLRTAEYNELFAGDPMWITEAIGGIGEDGRPLVSRSSYRFLHTLRNLGPAPEPNLTVLWSDQLPDGFLKYCAALSVETDSLQYENDDLMRPVFGDDYSIACCVSATRTGSQMQYFGARCNLPKVLLLALNGGRDEISGEQIGPVSEPYQSDILKEAEVRERFEFYQSWLCRLYVKTMNVIHAMHDKYAYEKLQMALHDSQPERVMAFGLAGLSVAADSISAIRHARVRVIRDQRGLISDFVIEGDYPQYGNDDDRADSIAVELTEGFYRELTRTPCYRGARHTLSVLTITSNVVYGHKTGATPDGRKAGEPFAPGANPMHGRDRRGALASLNSTAKLPFEYCQDGISCTASFTPTALGRDLFSQSQTICSILRGYFLQGGHHLNVNVLDRRQLEDAMENPERYPNLTIRVSGYAVHFVRLSREQQLEVLARTFYNNLS